MAGPLSFDSMPEDQPEQQAQTSLNQSGEMAPKSFDDLPEDPHPQSFDDMPEDGAQTQAPPLTGMQKAAGIAEAAGRGASFGLSTLAETAMGVPKEDIKAREAGLDPMTLIGAESAGAVGSMFIPGVGEGWLLGKAGTAIAHAAFPLAKEANNLAKIGRVAIRGGIEMSGFAAGDELSDALLDKGHDAVAVVGHIVGAGAAGFLLGGALGVGGAKLEALQNQKYGEYLDNFAIGLGAASKGEERIAALRQMHADFGQEVPKGIENGIKFFNDMSKKISGKAVDLLAGAAGAAAAHTEGITGMVTGALGGGVGYEAAKKWLEPYADKLGSKISPVIAKNVATPIMLQALKLGDTVGITNAMNYGTKAARGTKMIQNAINHTLNLGGNEIAHAVEMENDKLNDYIQKGGINQQVDQLKREQPAPQNFAEGGKVIPKPIESKGGVATMYPAQNQMLTTVKGRVSNYLTQLQPQEPPGMMFDTPHKDEAKERSYRSALSIANAPLSVLSHIKHGTVTLEHIQHLNGMYPELHDHLSKKITETLTKHQYDEEKRPNYKVRQGLAMFMGSPLDSTMTPQSIIAAQSVFAPKQPPQQPAPTKNKKGTASLGKFSKDYETPEQQRQSRATKD